MTTRLEREAEEEVKKEPRKMEDIHLTKSDRALLSSMKMFPQLDKSSQDNLRFKIDKRRHESKDFDEAFTISIGSIFGGAKQPTVKSKVAGVIDAVTHPIEAVKGKIAEKGLKSRNKAPKILEHPHETLKAIATPWDFEKEKQEDLIAIVRKMGAALRETTWGNRLGIAAPQIGISRRIFVCGGAVCVNPEWQAPKHKPVVVGVEACYSVPKRQFKVERDEYGWATFYSIDGEKREFKLNGINAIVYQHELSHLNGQCCVDIGVECTPETA